MVSGGPKLDYLFQRRDDYHDIVAFFNIVPNQNMFSYLGRSDPEEISQRILSGRVEFFCCRVLWSSQHAKVINGARHKSTTWAAARGFAVAEICTSSYLVDFSIVATSKIIWDFKLTFWCHSSALFGSPLRCSAFLLVVDDTMIISLWWQL